jgi:hypothetical protein
LLLEFFDVAVMALFFVHLDVRIDLPQCFSECGVKVIFDVVISSSRELLGDLGPAIAQLLLHSEENLLLRE